MTSSCKDGSNWRYSRKDYCKALNWIPQEHPALYSFLICLRFWCLHWDPVIDIFGYYTSILPSTIIMWLVLSIIERLYYHIIFSFLGLNWDDYFLPTLTRWAPWDKNFDLTFLWPNRNMIPIYYGLLITILEKNLFK